MGIKNQQMLPEHLAPFDGDSWAIWRWVGLRSAGFPTELLKLLGSSSGVQADAILAAENLLSKAYLRLSTALGLDLEGMQEDKRQRVVQRIIHRLEHKQTFNTMTQDAQAALPVLQIAQEAVASARADFECSFKADIVCSMEALHQIGNDPTFREALVWQNRHALQNGVDVLLAKPLNSQARTSKQRQREALIASYLQRYCTKNDTIGFFGPVGWARIMDQGQLITVEAGPALLAKRTVYFETWCIDALAELLTRDEALRPWLIPRRMPFVHIEGKTLHLPLTPPLPMTAIQATVLHACDGERNAIQLAQDLLRTGTPGLRNIEDVYEVLRILLAKNRIAWRLEVPIESLYPEQKLYDQLDRIKDERKRTSALAMLAELVDSKEAVARSAGNAEQLNCAMAHLEDTFTRITGANATRHAGKFYAGRSLVYEDCLRNLITRIGPTLGPTLGPALGLLLTSARWFTFEAAGLYRTAFNEIYDEIAGTDGSSVVPFSSFWLYAHSLLFQNNHPLLAILERRLQERWIAIFALSEDQRRVLYQTEGLRVQVEKTFAAPHPGWSSAYYHSPDVLIAATSQEAINKGEFQYILGEIHPGANTLQSAFFPEQHPQSHELLQAIKADRPKDLVVFVPSKELEGATARMSNGFVLHEDRRLVFAHDSCDIPASRILPISTLMVTRVANELVVQTRDGTLQWDILDILGDFIMLRTIHSFDILPKAIHTPRITIDNLIVRREAWCFKPQECGFVNIEQEAERFLEARRWLHKHNLPHRMFVKTPGERKPLYVDFNSLLSIDVLARLLHRVTPVDAEDRPIMFTEMLPDLHECWLEDHQQHYTCEFRMVVVDQRASARVPRVPADISAL